MIYIATWRNSYGNPYSVGFGRYEPTEDLAEAMENVHYLIRQHGAQNVRLEFEE